MLKVLLMTKRSVLSKSAVTLKSSYMSLYKIGSDRLAQDLLCSFPTIITHHIFCSYPVIIQSLLSDEGNLIWDNLLSKLYDSFRSLF